MGVVKLSTAGLTDYQKYGSLLAGNSPYSTGSFDLLETQVLTSSASSVTFTGLGSYSDYKHLQVRMVVKDNDNVTTRQLYTQFNSDTGASYAAHYLGSNGSIVFSGGYTSQTRIYTANIFGSAKPFTPIVQDILDFSSSNKNTTTRTFVGRVENAYDVFLWSGLWVNTNAVTSITYTTNGASGIASGSRFSLYGIKGA